MHPIVHVFISIFVGSVVMLHYKHRFAAVIVSSIIVNGLIDSDVLFIGMGLFENRIFSTSITMVYFPLGLLLFSYLYERRSDSSLKTRLSLMIVLIGFSHLVLDTFSMEPVYLYYPFSMELYSLHQGYLPYVATIFVGLVIAVNLMETQIYNAKEGKNKGHEVTGEVSPFLSKYKKRLEELKGDEEEGFYL
ncbi:MAG: hypothetical protein ACQESD_03340 [Thermoplasmatota archaeon]